MSDDDETLERLDREVEQARSREPWRRDADWWFDVHRAPEHKRDPFFDGWYGLAIMGLVAATFVFVLARAFGVWS